MPCARGQLARGGAIGEGVRAGESRRRAALFGGLQLRLKGGALFCLDLRGDLPRTRAMEGRPAICNSQGRASRWRVKAAWKRAGRRSYA